MPALKWTEGAIREEAAKYGTKAEFMRDSGGTYDAARKRFPHLLDELFGKTFRWTEEAIRAEAAKYSTKAEFVKKCSGGERDVTVCRASPELTG